MKNIIKEFKVPLLLGVIIMALELVIILPLSPKIAVLISFIIPCISSISLLIYYKKFDMCGWFTITNSGTIVLFIVLILVAIPGTMLNYDIIYSLMLSWFGAIIPCFIIKFADKNNKYINFRTFFKLISIIFACIYLFTLSYALFFKDGVHGLRGINIIPFKTIVPYLTGNALANRGTMVVNLLANVLLFVPLGFYLAIINIKNNVFYKIGIFLAVPLTIEIVQFILKRGISDIDDIILNFLGSLLGMVLYVALEKTYSIIQQNSDERMLEL